jgi:hypothetical protein
MSSSISHSSSLTGTPANAHDSANESSETNREYHTGIGDHNSQRKRRLPHSHSAITLSDCQKVIADALAEKRLTPPKALRLRQCLDSSDVMQIVLNLLHEHIPKKRSTSCGGYKCKLCDMPLKGHVCPYCPVCSTPNDRYEKDGGHACFNCPQCFDAGRRKKKLVQIRIGEGSCPHGEEKRDEGVAALLGLSERS